MASLSRDRRRRLHRLAIAHALVERGDEVRILDNFSTGRERTSPTFGERSSSSTAASPTRRALRARAGRRRRPSRGGHPVGAALDREPLGDHHVNATAPARPARRRAVAGVRRVVFAASSSAYGETPDAAQGRDHAARAALALRGVEARRRALLPGLRAALRPRDGGPALLQRLRAAPGSEVAVRGGHPELRHRRAAGRRRPSSATAPSRATSATSTTSSRPTCWPARAARRRARCSTSPAARRPTSIRWSTSSPHRRQEDRARHEPARAGDIKHSLADIGRRAASSATRAAISFADGLERTIAWYAEAPSRSQRPASQRSTRAS